MIYLSWISIVEGPTDRSYFDILLPRVMDDIALSDGTQEIIVPPMPVARLGNNGRTVDAVAMEACSLESAAYLLFVHADTGGRSLEQGIRQRGQAYCEKVGNICGWPKDRCIVVAPRHETEAWVLADPPAVMSAFGYAGRPESIGLPRTTAEAERLVDPKAALEAAFVNVRKRRTAQRIGQVLPLIAQEQSINALRASKSFQDFEADLRTAMASLGCIPCLN